MIAAVVVIAAAQAFHWSDVTVAGAFMFGVLLGVIVVLGVARFGYLLVGRRRLMDDYFEQFRSFRDEVSERERQTPP